MDTVSVLPGVTSSGKCFVNRFIEPVKGTRTEAMVAGFIFFSCDCIDIGVPGDMGSIGV